LRQDYFQCDPVEIIDLWLFRDRTSRSLIDAAVEITPILQNLSEHAGDLRGAKLQHLRRNAARISRTCD